MTFELLLQMLREAVEREAAMLGVTVNGELQGTVEMMGQPQSANGFCIPVGKGLPVEWRKAVES